MHLTVIEPLDGSKLCKRRLLTPGGEIIKLAEDRLTRGRVSVWPMPYAHLLGSALDSFTYQSMVLGVPAYGSGPIWWLTTKEQVPADRPDVLARSLDYFRWPDGPGWMLVDFDRQCDPAAALSYLWPEIAEASILIRPSSSNVHAFILIARASEAPAITRELIRRSTSIGIPDLIDPSVASPERLIFVAPPICHGFQWQRGRSWWQEGCAIGMAGIVEPERMLPAMNVPQGPLSDPAGWDEELCRAVDGYILSVVHGMASDLRSMRKGGRSMKLFHAGAKLGNWHWTGAAALAGAGDLLLEAAADIGYFQDYGKETAIGHLVRGFEHGASKPETLPVLERWARKDEILAMGSALIQRMRGCP